MIIYPTAVEGNLSTATDVGGSNFVRVLNTAATTGLVTIRSNPDDASKIRTVTLGAGEAVVIRKESTDTLEGGADFRAVSVMRQQ